MNIDVLLIYPPYKWESKSPPLGIAYLAAVLEKAGFKPVILDMDPLGLQISDLKKEIEKYNPKIVGISFMTPQIDQAIQVAKIIKKMNRDIPIVMGGPHVSAVPEQTLKSSAAIDYAIVGEGEMTMKELTEHIIHGQHKLEEIDGLVFRKNNHLIRTKPRQFIEDLDEIPFPAWHLLPVEKYNVRGTGFKKNTPISAILSSRGCPNQCIFCDSHTIFGRKFRGRSAENMFAEIKMLNQKYNISQFDFIDDTITIDQKRMDELCDLIINSKLNLTWACNARVNTVTYPLLQKMKKAGCVRVDFGVESGDPHILRVIKKGITLDQIRQAHQEAKRVGIQVMDFYMIGLPEQDMKSIDKSLSLINELDSDFPCFSIATPYPGTELFQIAKKNNWLRVYDWKKYNTGSGTSSDYQPIMVTDQMNEKQIIKAARYVSKYLLPVIWAKEYGKFFYLNPKFYIKKFRKIKNCKDLWKKIKSLRNLLKI